MPLLRDLDGRNFAMVIKGSLARVIATTQTTIVCLRSNLHPKNTECGPHGARARCAVIRILRLVFVGVAFVLHGTAQWSLSKFSRTLAIGDSWCCPLKLRNVLGRMF